LLEDLDKLDWEPHIKELQRNWIGKSEGSEITFTLQDFAQQESLTVFTTRADTLCGATFMAISFDLAKKWIEQGWKASDEVVQTISQIEADAKKQDFSFKEVLEKKGVDTGIRAVNPSTGEVIHAWNHTHDGTHKNSQIRSVILKKTLSIILAGICVGMAIASKISAVYILPVFGCLLFVLVGTLELQSKRHSVFLQRCLLFVIFGATLMVTIYLAVRIAGPYYFATSNIFSLRLHPNFIDNIEELKRLSNSDGWFPPGVQWIHKSKPWFALQNIAWFGLGLGMTIATVVGFAVLLGGWLKYQVKKSGITLSIALWGVVVWATGILLYQAMQIAHTLRYFLILYPFFAVLAAIGIHWLFCRIEATPYRLSVKRAMQAVLVVVVSLWTVAFCHIYTVPHSRIAASKWMWDNMPNGSQIGLEHWDDPLPLNLPGTGGKIITGVEMPIFGQDTDEKWVQMKQKFAQIQYYVMTSNRGWGSVTTVPERFPQQTKFYKDLFAEKTEFTHLKTFTSYPTLCVPWTQICYHFDDQWSEEAFTVYDHPKVMIYIKK
jgi:hypothetical protein